MQPFGCNRYGPKIGGCAPLGRGTGSPSSTMWQGPKPTYAKFHLDPSDHLATIHQRYRQDTGQTGHTGRADRQRGQQSDNIGQTVLQTVAQKLHFSRSITSTISAWSSKLMVDYDSMVPTLQLVKARVLNLLPSKLSRDFKLCRMSILHNFQRAIFPCCLMLESRGRVCW